MGGLIFTAIAVACIALQYLLPRYLPNWTGLFILVPYVAVVVFIVFTVGLHGFRDFIMPLAGFFGLMGVWGQGIEKKKRVEKEAAHETE
ncbi:hypothetical protein L3H50_06650 [Corynebacterium sp. MC-04]|uniref:Uncharacterized protein n=1 Tax=Corynebacterium parakroppenstedtii TaxID=2828363 RepID=A0ABS9HJZ4_9CORY|nr:MULTISPECIES: hypothetical protein [Corynebacterium]KXB49321.1 hypothetical protein HMPREF1861_02085 [Corynebacterium kroppenstedtii]MBY0792776.1 hypothetical protein [Corynebacterium parakroppenstedtii]MBY0796877.1 hypothetical protein [Corynebacterium parakroppenstedtii]MCF6770132.1 hypothetical protein [Corynebacterium parakroppenstedtii]MCF6772229.1 hypothetical protein [Corynebacterium parakroppenstedtii]